MPRRPDYEPDDKHFTADAYTVKGYGGVAWYVLGWEMEPGLSEWWDDDAQEWVYDSEPEPVRTGKVVAVMVGDDRRFVFDEDEIKPLSREDYCAGCGQIGCTADGLVREES